MPNRAPFAAADTPPRKAGRPLAAVLCIAAVLAAGCGRHAAPVSPAARPTAAVPSPSRAEATAGIDWADLMPAGDLRPPPSFSSRMLGMAGPLGDASMANGPAYGGGIGGGLPTARIDHSGTQRARQFGSSNVVAALDGRDIALRGYVVPLETDDAGRLTEFLFVPFYGACIHVPPPPPNQMVYARLGKPMSTPEPWTPFTLHGRLRTQRFDADIASAAYRMDAARLTVIAQ